ncbi:MAG: DUF4870 domain-containing protein [Draconibacterium sp.]
MSNQNLAKNIRDLRSRKGISQELLAEKSGVSLRTVQRIENGETEPRGDTIGRLANALEVAPDELIEWTLVEDKAFILNLNISALCFLIFPVLGIIVPFILWANKKDKIKNVHQVGAEIINFQITWSILYFVCLPLVVVLRMINTFDRIEQSKLVTPSFISSDIIGNLYLFGGVLLLITGYNLALIIINIVRSNKGKTVKYFPKIRFIR